MPEIIVVIGATGSQGGSVVKALLENGKYTVRGVTRNVNSDKAKELTKNGVEVVQAELNDVASLEKAFSGAYGAFFITNYFEHFDVNKEIQHTKNLADAAKTAGLKHVVLSSLEDTRKIVREGSIPKHGDYYLREFDGKGEAQEYVAKEVPTTIMLTTFFYENFINFKSVIGPKTIEDGSVIITMPMGKSELIMVATQDIGKCGAKLFEDPNNIGKTVGVASCIETVTKIAEILSATLGKTVTFKDIEPAEFAKLGFPGAEDLANTFHYFRDYVEEMKTLRNLDFSRNLIPNLVPFEDWILQNKSALL